MSRPPMVVDVYSHYLVVRPDTKTLYAKEQWKLASNYARRYIHWDVVKKWDPHNRRHNWSKEIKAVYATQCKDKTECRYHISDLHEYTNYLRNNGYTVDDGSLVINHHDPDKIKWPSIEQTLNPKFSLYPIQQDAINFCMDYGPNKRTKLVELKTGEGKSLVSMGMATATKSRIVMIIRSQYLEKWYEDIHKSMVVKPGEVVIVRGGDSLRSLFNSSLDGGLDNIKAILISNRTFQNYITQYEVFGKKEMEKLGYLVLPDKYCEALGAKLLLVDEGHQDFHFNFKLLLYTHCQVSVTTTATLSPDDLFLKRMANQIFPVHSRFNPGTVKNYMDIIAFWFRFNNPEKIRCMVGRGYSHIEFEKSIMRNKKIEKAYYEMIASLIEDYYIQNKKPGYKAIIFFSSTKMCTRFTSFCKDVFKDLTVERFIAGDPYENLIMPDIRIATPGKAGTAVDIPGLYLEIQTIAVGSSQLNKQMAGRLREMKKGNPIHPNGETPVFLYFVCGDIDKHVDYHRAKPKLLEDKMRTMRDIHYSKIL